MTQYRVCKNDAPHRNTWWTVEKTTERKRFLRKPVTEWTVVSELIYFSVMKGATYSPIRFDARDEALKWIEQDKRPVTHECEEIA